MISEYKLKKYTPYVAPTGELWGVYFIDILGK